MEPYVIKQGDHLALLAYQFGFDADMVWNDPKNAQQRDRGQLSQDPNILNPTDVLYIPDQNVPPVMKSLTPGSTNTFVSDVSTLTLTPQFVGADPATYASKAYTVQELDQLTGLATDENGIATFKAPVTLATATLIFTDTGETWTLRIGDMDPINALSGIFKRLQNLGYIASSILFDTDAPLNNLDLLRSALVAFKAAQASSGDSPSSSSSISGTPSDPAPATDPSPASEPSNIGSSDSAPPSSALPRSAPPNSANGTAADQSGLADNGTLDADTTTLLCKVHGC